MATEFIYLLQANAGIALFYAFYKLFCCRDTFLVWRRVVLLLLPVLSFLLPWVGMSDWMQGQTAVTRVADYYETLALPEVLVTPLNSMGRTVGFYRLCSLVLWVGMVSLCGRILIQLISLFRLARISPSGVLEGVRVRYLQEPSGAFSFFGWIFVCKDSVKPDEVKEVLTHELAHVRQWHSVDILLMEALTAICWWNPFAWLVRQEVRRNLEYLADRSVIASGVAPRHYQYHLLQAVCSFPEIGLSNHFNFTHLKERIIMMNKKQTNGAAHLKYVLFALPAFALLVAGNVSCTSETKPADEAVQENPEKVAVEAEPGKEQPVPSESSNVTVSVAEVGEGQAIPEASSAEEDILEVAEVMPEFPGGYKALLEFISKNVSYPEEAMKNAWQGRVVLQFVIEKDGAVSNIKVLRSVNETLDNEAMRVIREMPKWTPGKDKGKEVRCKYTIPIVFALK